MFMDQAKGLWAEVRDMGLRKLLFAPLFEYYHRMWLAGLDVRFVVFALDRMLKSTKKKLFLRF